MELELEAEENCALSGNKPQEKPRKHDSGAADLERVTDYAEEKEIRSEDLQTVSQLTGSYHPELTGLTAGRRALTAGANWANSGEEEAKLPNLMGLTAGRRKLTSGSNSEEKGDITGS